MNHNAKISLKPRCKANRRFAARGWTVRASITKEQWEATGRSPATVTVCYGVAMRMVTLKQTTNEYGVPMMTFYFKAQSNDGDKPQTR